MEMAQTHFRKETMKHLKKLIRESVDLYFEPCFMTWRWLKRIFRKKNNESEST